METSDPIRLALTVPQAAQALQISERFVYYLIASGELVTVKLGRATRISVADLEAFIAARRIPYHQSLALEGERRTEDFDRWHGQSGGPTAKGPYREASRLLAAQIRCGGQRVTASGDTADAARRNLQAKLDSLDETAHPATVERTVGEFLRGWIEELRATEALKPATWRRYDGIVRCYLVPALGERTLGELTKQDVANLIRDARAGLVTGRSGKRASETTLHHVHAVLRVGLGSALEQGLIDRNVARLLKAPSMRHRPKVILDRAEARRLMTAARGTPFGAAIILGLPTGMREGEILGLRRGDVDFERSELVVSSTVRIGYNGRWELGEPKTEAGQRSIPLPDFALDALREHLARQDPPSLLVFPSADGT